MQLPSIEQSLQLRPVSAELASMAAGKVIPVAPVNPAASSAPPVDPTPGVVNLVNQANKPISGEGVYTSVSDPARPGSEAATGGKDWTIHRPVAEKVEDPPPVPLSKILLDHIKSLWIASANAIQTEQVKNQLDPAQAKPDGAPGILAKEVLTYSPSKINKTENI